MRNKLLTVLSAGLLGLATISCDKVTDDLDIIVNSDVIRYNVLVQVDNANGGQPNDLQISVSGKDAAHIYDAAGNKDLIINNGIISLGVHPKNEPTENSPIEFNVKLSGPGYISSTVPVTITKDNFNQVRNVKMVKLTQAPPTVVVKTQTATLTNGTSATPITVTSPATTATPVATKIEVPANTQFLTQTGTPITGGSINLSVVNFNTQSTDIAKLFPGGQLNAADVTDKTGSKESVFFVPAGFAFINMSIGGTEVKKFSNPINVTIDLNPEFRGLNGTTPITAGDNIEIWSYSEDTGKWKYDKEATVAMVNGKPRVTFSIDHLTGFTAAKTAKTTSCKNPRMKFSANWLNKDSQPMTLEIWNTAETQLLVSKTIIMKNGLEEELQGMPSFDTKYKIKNNRDEVIATGNITNSCAGGVSNVNLPAPAAAVVGITLTLTVKCPNKGIVITPDFYLYYKPTGAPESAYKLLGLVQKGKISTTLLDVNKTYDFKAIWGQRVKVVNNHTITSKDMSTTVGVNDFLGTKTPDKNKAILIEECNKL
jgi:hypothetical protein